MLLARRSIVWEDLSNQKKSLAVRVYKLAQDKLDKMSELKEQMQECLFTKSSLAEDLGINRKTLGHNNPEISTLIDMLAAKARQPETDKELQEENAELKREIGLLVEKDVKYIQKDMECQQWKTQFYEQKAISEKRKHEIEALNKRIDDLLRSDSLMQAALKKNLQQS